MQTEKLDLDRFFKPEVALEHVEKQAKSYVGFIPNAEIRKMTEAFNTAGFEFARAQITATRSFGEAMQKAFLI